MMIRTSGFILAVILILAQIGLSSVLRPVKFSECQLRPPASGQKAPAVIHSSLEEIVSDFNQPVLLVFFSLACHVCWEELFEMKDFMEKMNLPVLLIGVSADGMEQLQSFASRYSFSYPIVQDKNRKLYRKYKVRLEPYRVVIHNRETVYADDYLIDYETRRERAKQCLLNLVSEHTFF